MSAVPSVASSEASRTLRPQDLEVRLDDRPGALAELGEALGEATIPLLGGGTFAADGGAVAHFLVPDGPGAVRALEARGIGPATLHHVVTLRLAQGTPGQLGTLCRRMADAGVDLRVQYSDHDHALVLVPREEHRAACQAVAAAWMAEVTA